MPGRILRRTGRYLGAAAAMGLMTGVLFSLRPWLNTSSIALLYLLPVGLSTALWGLGPGLLSALLAFFGFNYLFLPPYFTLTVTHPDNLVALFVFLAVAVVISQLLGRIQESLMRARAHEREAVHASEMVRALTGLGSPQAIASVLADRVQKTFLADNIEVNLQIESSEPPERVILPLGVLLPREHPTKVVAIQGMGRVLGEISLWRWARAFSPEEDRFLGTLASEAALALERVGLAQAENRARLLEQSDAFKSALLSSVSHELRTPLATIMASVTSLQSGEVQWDEAARRDLLSAIEEETEHLNQLVGNLLDMSRIEAGILRPQRTWNLLSEVIQSVLHRMRKKTLQHRVVVDVPEDLPLVPLDFIQIEQVFTNLLDNSLKYSPPGTSIRIAAGVGRDEQLTVEVSNEGPAVPEEHLGRMFGKFSRLPGVESVTGTGLGLSICKGIVEAHGGRIWAENLPSGLSFRLTLPLTLPDFPQAEAVLP
jgi:two-component system sensor histidine kinase KdpD